MVRFWLTPTFAAPSAGLPLDASVTAAARTAPASRGISAQGSCARPATLSVGALLPIRPPACRSR